MDKKELAARFRELGASFRIDRRNAEVTLSLTDPRRAEDARKLFYAALTPLENDYTVFIEGVPACFMPDAWDHTIYRARAGRRYARIRQCSSCSLKTLCPGLEAGGAFSGELRSSLRPVLPVPAELVFELTKRCNLACRVCAVEKTSTEQPRKKLLALLRRAAALGITSVRFTGGEPFLSRELLPMLKEAKRLGLYTLVNTNAAAGACLSAAIPFIDNVLVSLQGHDAASDAAATGRKGLFRRKLANMRALRRAVPVFRLGTVASPVLLKNFATHRALAAALGADVWEIYRPMRADGGGTAVLLRKLSRAIASAAPGGPRTLIANPMPLCLVPRKERKNLLGAMFDDGHTRIVYDPRGFFKPSYYITEDLGKEPGAAWKASYMKDLRAFGWLAPRCRNCRWLPKCLGGSRFMAKAAGGAYSAADPWLPADLKSG
jgi:MoaA/NifB/PqqE/SkfB family radical SAM enzyme